MTQLEVPPMIRRPVESRNPSTGETWATFPTAGANQVNAAVAIAREASSRWRTRPIRERARILENFRHRVAARKDDVIAVLHREIGKPKAEAAMEALVSADFARFCARSAPRLLRPRAFRAASLAVWRKKIRVEHEPWGVIGAITPWNYPLILASGIVLPALVTGNAVVLKPSEYAPSTAVLLADLLRDSGLPEGLLQVVQGDGLTGAALVEAAIDKIFFIGSAASGRKVAMRAAEKLLPCSLELGGSDPAIVLEDVDLPTAAAGIAWGRFTNAGQTCVAPKRLYVVDSVYDDFLKHLKREVEALKAGPEGDVGTLIRPIQFQLAEAQLRDAIDRGARVVARAEARPGFFPPTVLANVTSEMRVMREETFGPILPVIRVRDSREAVEMANRTSFGLSGSVWSGNVARATELGRQLEAGTVSINDAVVPAAIAEVPHGGVKASGWGRAHGQEGLLECVRTKTLVIDRFPRWSETYWQTGPRAQEGLTSFLDFAHGRGLLSRLRSGLRALRRFYGRS